MFTATSSVQLLSFTGTGDSLTSSTLSRDLQLLRAVAEAYDIFGVFTLIHSGMTSLSDGK